MQKIDETTQLEAIEEGLKSVDFDEFFETTTAFDPVEFAMRRC